MLYTLTLWRWDQPLYIYHHQTLDKAVKRAKPWIELGYDFKIEEENEA